MIPGMTACECCRVDPALTLFAVCDVLVFKALEAVGKWIVRAERSRFNAIGLRPMHEAHILWPVDADREVVFVGKALRGAWDAVPAVMVSAATATLDHDVDPAAVTKMLDTYVHDLVITGKPHTLAELRYRFHASLGIMVTLPELLDCPADHASTT